MLRTSIRHKIARFVALALVLAPVRTGVVAQSFAPRDATSAGTSDARATSGYRIAVGERATYDVELKGHGVGTGSLEVVAREQVDGFETLHAALKLEGGLLFAKVNDNLDSWFDPTRFYSRRFEQNNRELTHTRIKKYDISPERRTVHERVANVVDSLSTNEPLDEVSMLFFVRTLPLRVGEVDTIPRYFKAGRDVIVRVVRLETVTVPAGTFQTIVVQPTITNAGGLFGEGGKAEVYFTNDANRTLVKMRSSIPVIGTVGLTLRSLGAAK